MKILIVLTLIWGSVFGNNDSFDYQCYKEVLTKRLDNFKVESLIVENNNMEGWLKKNGWLDQKMTWLDDREYLVSYDDLTFEDNEIRYECLGTINKKKNYKGNEYKVKISHCKSFDIKTNQKIQSKSCNRGGCGGFTFNGLITCSSN